MTAYATTEELWTPKDFARHYLLTARDVRKKLRAGKIPGAKKPFGRWLIDINEFRASEEEKRLNPPHPTNWKCIPLPPHPKTLAAERRRAEAKA